MTLNLHRKPFGFYINCILIWGDLGGAVIQNVKGMQAPKASPGSWHHYRIWLALANDKKKDESFLFLFV